jgi:hypothetical protein
MTTKKNKSTVAKKTRGRPRKNVESKLETLETSTGKAQEAESKLDTLSFADGKQDEKIRKAKELEDLVGLNQVNPYGTSVIELFEEKLNDMTLVDMQALAVTVGVFPSGTKTSLRKKLEKSFRDYQRGSASFIIPPAGPICENADRDSEQFKKALDLMKEGL